MPLTRTTNGFFGAVVKDASVMDRAAVRDSFEGGVVLVTAGTPSIDSVVEADSETAGIFGTGERSTSSRSFRGNSFASCRRIAVNHATGFEDENRDSSLKKKKKQTKK